MSQEHILALAKHCRICGNPFTKRKGVGDRRFSCSDRKNDLQEVFGIKVDNDVEALNPHSYCHPCNNIIYHTRKKSREGKTYNPRKVIVTWSAHSEHNCLVCKNISTHSVGGRPKKQLYTPGRPSEGSFQSVIQHVRSTAPPSFCQQETAISPHVIFDCPVCMDIVDRPIELKGPGCNSLVCADCLCKWLHVSQTTSCPCCYEDYRTHTLDLDSIHPPSEITLKALGSIEVTCYLCKKRGCLKHHKSHIESMCSTANFSHAPLTPMDLLSRPEDAALLPIEEKLQSKLIKRSMRNSHTLEVKTGGQHLTLVKVSSPRVSSGTASQRTLRRRSGDLSSIRKTVSGGQEVAQMSNEVTVTTKEDREKLVEKLKQTSDCFQVKFSVTESLGLQSVLMIPYYKLRIMKNMLGPNVKIASEKKMRAEGDSLAGVENLKSEYVPFTFPIKDGRHTVEIKNVPMCYTPNLWEKIESMLCLNDDAERRVHRLTWHEGKVPENEIWIKLGGEKGGGSFKMTFQICNIDHPNSPVNTCTFCIFEAPDNVTNLKIGLQRFQDEVDSLHGKTWRGKTIRVFLSGDYEFLCNMFGLSGASGRHCCLWCLVKSEELKNPPANVPSRSTDSIVRDHRSFIAAGGNLKNVKHFNNCAREPFFKSIPLNQLCPPGLHITLGIFYRLFQLMENECHQLDLSILEEKDSREKGGPSYSNFMDDIARAKTLKDEVDRVNEEIDHLNDLVALLVVFGQSEEGEDPEEDDPQLQALRSELEEKATTAKKLDTEWTKLDETISKYEFKIEDGPVVKFLDTTLEGFNVRRQSYYGGTFVGNHVHLTLRPENTVLLCNAVVLATSNYSPSIRQRAEKIQRKFSVVFALFHNCDTLYNQSKISQEEIAALRTHITMFMAFYREHFPHSTVIPKMHMLEKHVVDWLGEWKLGLGLMGEQGAESIHAYFNNLKRSYSNITNGVERLRCMMKQHFVHIAPSNIVCRPLPVKRRKKNPEN